ncbi:prepilin-type N-terminal cleavage/methylation domain-containing protein [Ningiella sp. W23]|uniref:prepilin-type N-terminal cleavage/methylation domain-containing protein n=1 Tax=Ningiella sp. W23 TaxID=3023715 RepID=UPI0037562E8F
MHKYSKGFTLIELVIVIIIIGIIAITAAPRFIELGSDARIATLDSLEANMLSAANLVNVKARIEDKTDCASDPIIEMGGQNITLRCGYPCPHPNGIARTLVTDDSVQWIGGNCAGLLGRIEARLSKAPDPTNCKLRYAASTGTAPPFIIKTTSGC